MTGQGERSITYQPALDGLRAVAVVMVLMFHLGLSWMTGGYLGVSVFFTLSGFLITTLLIHELDRSGDIRLGRFYGRRARRLLPASLLALAGACVLIATKLVPDRSGLRWYIFGGLFQFANWVPLGLQNSYGELFNALSPTDHFWSLAIEEQFYWIWPVTMLGLFRVITRRRSRDGATDWTARLLRVLTVLFIVFSASAPLTAWLWRPDAAYFATWARIPEILAGGILAVIVFRFRLPRWVTWLSPVALVAVVVLAVITPTASGFAYRGALPLFALVSAALIAGLQHPSPVSWLLSRAPLVSLGLISYGVYLYHWPVFVVLTEARTGLSLVPLSILRLALTMAISVLSYVLIEQPIRRRRFLARPRLAIAATAVAIPLVVLLGITQVSNSASFERTGSTLAPVQGTVAPLLAAPATITPRTPPAPTTMPAAPIATSAPAATTTLPAAVATAPSATVPAAAATPTRPVRMLVIGDSTALATGAGLSAWAQAKPQIAQVEVLGFGGCGLMSRGERSFRGEWLAESAGCIELFETKVPARLRDAQPDIVVVINGFWDVTDRRLPPDPTPRSVLDRGYREQMLEQYTAYNQRLLDAGAPRVAWVLYPATDYDWGARYEPADDPARFVAFYEVQRLAAAPFDGRVSTIDLARWSDGQGLTSDVAGRPDGVHWTPEVASRLAEEWLGNEIVQAALR